MHRATAVWLDPVGFFGVANRVSNDLRAERDAFIADEDARECRTVAACSYRYLQSAEVQAARRRYVRAAVR